ncbi:hypothetical protein MRB53_038565 [Persea americana]|nr:hypothetical protein MRB53_038565 [Persea americana]
MSGSQGQAVRRTIKLFYQAIAAKSDKRMWKRWNAISRYEWSVGRVVFFYKRGSQLRIRTRACIKLHKSCQAGCSDAFTDGDDGKRKSDTPPLPLLTEPQCLCYPPPSRKLCLRDSIIA